ncbi:unnamed protein product [Mesocestoides corti]|uniref:Uncharacterized protein n=1 Tax=Mesocestoides corti TaxID=53468 RepID=A0A3P6I0B5_MESCO|nr:unnamed protein product [Mesocestoides corti]
MVSQPPHKLSSERDSPNGSSHNVGGGGTLELPLTPPRTQPPSDDETDSSGPKKSFYSVTELSVALSSLLPDQIVAAKERCLRLRYPPTLAALMQKDQLASKKDLVVNVGKQTKPRSYRPTRDTGFLEIDASHFDYTLVNLPDMKSVKSEGSDRGGVEAVPEVSATSGSSGSGRSTPTRVSKRKASKRPTNKSVISNQKRSCKRTRIEASQPSTGVQSLASDVLSNADDSDMQFSDGEGIVSVTEAPRSLPLTHSSLASDKQSPLSLTEPSATLGVQDSSTAPTMLKRNRRYFSLLPPVQRPPTDRPAEPNSPSLQQSMPLIIDSTLSTSQRRSSLKKPTKLSVSRMEAIRSKCIEGSIYLDKFCQQLVACGIGWTKALEMSAMAVSSDFLVPSPCPFGRPHLVSPGMAKDSPRADQLLLVGDALRLIALASNAEEGDHQNALNCLRQRCRQECLSIQLDGVRVRTPKGLQVVPSEWTSLLTSFTVCLPVFLWLPVVVAPHQEILKPLFSLVSASPRRGAASWTSACSAEELAHLLLALYPSLSIPDPLQLTNHTSSNGLRDFLALASTPFVKWSNVSLPTADSPLTALVEMVPRRLHLVCRMFSCSQPANLAGLGLIALLFKRLFMHLFVNAEKVGRDRVTVLRHSLRLMESDDEDHLIAADTFSHLEAIHVRVSECLGCLRNAFPQLVSAGACLTALHRLKTDPSPTPADVGRSRLFDSAQDARDAILTAFKAKMHPCLVALFEALDSAFAFFNAVIDLDLFMFKQSLRMKTYNNACHLLRTGIMTLNMLEQTRLRRARKKDSDVNRLLDPVRLYRAKVVMLRPPCLLSVVDRLTHQLKIFRQVILSSRQRLSESWWPAFTASAIDETAATRVQQFVAEMQACFDTIELWSRCVHDFELKNVPQRMLSLLVQDVGESVSGLSELDVSAGQQLQIPFGSKNTSNIELSPGLISVPPLSLCPSFETAIGDGQNSTTATVVVTPNPNAESTSNSEYCTELLESAFSVSDTESGVSPPAISESAESQGEPKSGASPVETENSTLPDPAAAAEPPASASLSVEQPTSHSPNEKRKRQVVVTMTTDTSIGVESGHASPSSTQSRDEETVSVREAISPPPPAASKRVIINVAGDVLTTTDSAVEGPVSRKACGVDRRTLGRLMRYRKIRSQRTSNAGGADLRGTNKSALRLLTAMRKRSAKRRALLSRSSPAFNPSDFVTNALGDTAET